VVLRGGRVRTNYDPESIAEAAATLRKASLPEELMVDCSHANSGKQHARQEEVFRSLVDQRLAGATALIGAMIESYLEEGNQPVPKNLADLRPGVSVTDACISWQTTDRMLREAHERLTEAQAAVAAG
jgi:3-deoxy-7-phosphoheptulonate synthase